ncbi:MAG: 5-(carboxyamino)imidazole ribonucleotide synthase [Actinomycetota bacterium]
MTSGASPGGPLDTRPLDTIGILGSGQLAMMLGEAAANIGVRTHVLAPAHDLLRPVGDVQVVGDPTDLDALTRFAESVDVLTFETENTPIDTVAAVAERTLVRPTHEAVRIAQDRLFEKRFVTSVGGRTAPFAPIDGPDDMGDAIAEIGYPAILKTRRDGYDGKGQVRLTDPGDGSTTAAVTAWESLGARPCVLEGFVPFDAEISVVACRGADGTFVPFDPGQNEHRDGVLVETVVPAPVAAAPIREAIDTTRSILDELDYVGVAGVEFFVVGERVLVNEMAPRVHNSGHWTKLGCAINQFEQHVRAITGRPIGDGARHADVRMTNLLGHDVDDLDPLLRDPAASVVLYGKREVRPGRKMGHVNRITG